MRTDPLDPDSLDDLVLWTHAQVDVSEQAARDAEQRAALLQCAAHRRVIERHRPLMDHGRFSEDWPNECPAPGVCEHDAGPRICWTCRDYTGEHEPAPCPELLDVVACYRHRAGFRPEWLAVLDSYLLETSRKD